MAIRFKPGRPVEVQIRADYGATVAEGGTRSVNMKLSICLLFWHTLAVIALMQVYKSFMWAPEDYTDPIGSLCTVLFGSASARPIMSNTMWWAYRNSPAMIYLGWLRHLAAV